MQILHAGALGAQRDRRTGAPGAGSADGSCAASPRPDRCRRGLSAQARAELGAAEAARAQLRRVQAALAELAAGLPAAGGAAEAGAAVRRVAAELHELHRCGRAGGRP